MTKSQKALSAFVQMVNPKIEPLIHGIWIKKITTKGKEEPRFLAATNAALYVCKPATFSKCIKISQTYGWTKLVSVQSGVNNLTVFIFRDQKHPLRCVIDDPDSFVKKLFEIVRTILPEGHPATFGEWEGVAVRRRPTQFLDLFLSECHSAGISPNQSFLLNLRSSLRQKHTLCIDSSFEQRWLGPALRALALAEGVKRFEVHGRNDFELFTALVPCIVQNSELKSVAVCDCQSMKGLSAFVDACRTAQKLKVLTFRRVAFKQNIMDELVEKITATSIRKLAFIKCGNDPNLFQRMWEMPDRFTNLRKLEFSGCKIRASAVAVLESICVFCNQSRLVSLSLAKTGIDIPNFLTILSRKTVCLKSLDLSGNDFGVSVTEYTIPASVEVLNLSKVTWNPGAFAGFFGQDHILGTTISVDLSYIKAKPQKQEQMLSEISSVTPSRTFTSVIWNGNVLTAEFITFLEKFPQLKSLSLDNCLIVNDDMVQVMESLSTLISKEDLWSLSVAYTFAHSKSMLNYLRESLVNARSLKKLDVSGNAIGGPGLHILQSIILESESLAEIAFDDSNIPRLSLLSEFVTALLDCPRAVHLSKPKTDIGRLCQKCSRAERKGIRELWSRLIAKEEASGATRRMTEDFSSLLSIVHLSSGTSGTSFSSAMNTSSLAGDYEDGEALIDVNPITNQQTSWDLQIDLPCECDFGEWMRLKHNFSIRTLVGMGSDKSQPIDDPFRF